jgi:cell division protein FtsI/penicillin-binding protein 2
MRLLRSGAVAAAVLVTGSAALTACSSSSSTPTAVAHSYLADWAARDWQGMRALVTNPPADFTAVNSAELTDLGVKRASFAAGQLKVNGGAAHEVVTQRLEIPGVGTIPIKTTLRLKQASGNWRVAWTPATVARGLGPGDKLSLQLQWPPRAQILGAAGAPLTTQVPMVTIGVEGKLIKSDTVVRTALLAAGATKQAVSTALTGAKSEPTWFEPVVTVSQARYQQLKPTIYPIPGTVFENLQVRAPAAAGLDFLVGTVGPVTAQELQQLRAPYDAQSVVGQTGLERAYERQLAGTPGAVVSVVGASGSAGQAAASIPAKPGKPVETSIDPTVQRDLAAALAGVHKQAALVAVNATTGQVLASDSVPNSSGFDLAFDGAFPPGSSFKVITSTALIEHGLSPSSPATCPHQLTVDGEVFHNAEGEGQVSNLLHAFAESCNTAFIGLATRHLTAAEFPKTARIYGIGTTPALGLPAFGGSVPKPSDEAALAATTIGQAGVVVSPLDMAIVAAAVDSGQVHAARLVAGAPDDHVRPQPLPPNVVTDLHQMMAQVVATGTAARKGLPPGTFAKTGTAEYGHGTPLPTDAWLIGFNGNVAFAMVTVNGGEGGPTDGPIVAKFLDLLHQSGT